MDLVSVLCGTMRSEDLIDDLQTWFVRRAQGEPHRYTVLRRALGHSWLFYGACALAAGIAGTALRSRA